MKLDDNIVFSEFNVYLHFHKGQDRQQVVLYNKNSKKKTTITYAKYLLSIREGRILSREEEADHIDNDKTNDDINNLQILTREANFEKYAKTLSRTMVVLVCPNCGISFERERRNTHLIKGGEVSSCTRICAGKYQQKKKRCITPLA
jgi:hypothetical protein